MTDGTFKVLVDELRINSFPTFCILSHPGSVLGFLRRKKVSVLMSNGSEVEAEKMWHTHFSLKCFSVHSSRSSSTCSSWTCSRRLCPSRECRTGLWEERSRPPSPPVLKPRPWENYPSSTSSLQVPIISKLMWYKKKKKITLCCAVRGK